MQCMKCGREIHAGDVFCQECLTDMEKYPVKPGTVVTIPRQPVYKKQADRRNVATPEQKVKVLTKRVRILSFLLILCIALLIAVGGLLISMVLESEDEPTIGQNYTYEDSAEESTDET